MGRRRRAAGLAGTALLATALTGCDPQQPWQNELVSVTADGTRAIGLAGGGTFSPDGTLVVFSTYEQVYVRDLPARTTTLVSVATGGVEGGDRTSRTPVISPDGTKVAFVSRATDLVPTDTNGADDVFVRDLVAGTTTLVSARADGLDAGNGDSDQPSFSADGTELAFTSVADDLGPTDGDAAPGEDVYVRDLVAGTTRLVSTNVAGTGSAGGGSSGAVFAPGGRHLAFMSSAGDLAPGGSNGEGDVWLHDLATGTNELVTVGAAGTGGDDFSSRPTFSPDGTALAFLSRAGNLGPPDANGLVDVYVHDLPTGATELVSANAAGADGGDGPSEVFVFSPDGTRIAFQTQASDLGPTDTNADAICPVYGVGVIPRVPCPDVYLRDLTTGTTTLVSARSDGLDSGNHQSGYPVFSPDGTRIAFSSRASDLGPSAKHVCDVSIPFGPRELAPCEDVYVRDLTTGTTSLVTTEVGGTGSGNRSSGPSRFDPTDGRRLLFGSGATNLSPLDDDIGQDVYLATLRQADLSVDADGPARSGDVVTYRAEVTNHGPDPATDARLGVALPPGATPEPGTGGDGCAPAPEGPPVVECELGTLAPGTSAERTVSARVPTPGPAIVAARSPVADPDAGDNLVTLAEP
jgi:uncharacterized repeat protein (TIGR01451 family)